MKKGCFSLLILTVFLPQLLISCSDVGVSNAGGGSNAGSTCETSIDCPDGQICMNGYCIPDLGGDIDLNADGDATADGDVDRNDQTCEGLSGICVADETCPTGMRASYEPRGCGAPKDLCCLPDVQVECENQGGYCEAPVASACYRPGYEMVSAPAGCDLFGGFCCMPVSDCVENGGQGVYGADECCPGLMPIEGLEPILTDSLEDCKPICSNCFVCSRCGNGVCGAGENYCNCPLDCPDPTGYCAYDSDCGEHYCTESDGGVCNQILPYCDGGYCALWWESYENALCREGQCAPYLCEYGDKIMHDCWDGSQVVACECWAGGGWNCVENPDALCPSEPECGVGQTMPYMCTDGSEVPYCVCEGDPCPPVCDMIGTRSEGWYDSCVEGGLIAWALCADCDALCRNAGSESEGWYDSCSGNLLKSGPCSSHWVCVENPESQCHTTTRCEELGGYCLEQGEVCAFSFHNSEDERLGCPEESPGCCLPGNPNRCEEEGGFCAPINQGCPPGAPSSDFECRSNQICCMPEFPLCEEVGGICINGPSGPQNICPDGYFPPSGIPYVCTNGGFCCLPSGETACEREGGYCTDYNDWCDEEYMPITNPMGCESPTGLCCYPRDIECSSDSECGEADCYMDASANLCIEVTPVCIGGQCDENSATFQGAVCIDGECREDETLCETEGGYCSTWQEGCRPYYEGLPGTDFGCPGGYSSICCLPSTPDDCQAQGGYCNSIYMDCEQGFMPDPDVGGCSFPEPVCCMPFEVECRNDGDCGDPVCQMDQNAAVCHEIYPICMNGQCETYMETYPGSTCVNGKCRDEPPLYCHEIGGECFDMFGCPTGWTFPPGGQYECENGGVCCIQVDDSCEDAGGFCIGWGPECPDTHYYGWEYCGYGQCCMPVELGDCMREGGYCSSYDSTGEGCEYGYEPIEDIEGCPFSAPVCCLPVEYECRYDEECGRPACYDTSYSCMETQPKCENHRCVEETQSFPGLTCGPNGRCVEYAGDCTMQGGECQWGMSCPEGYMDAGWTEECNYFQSCCIPMAPECRVNEDCGRPECYDLEGDFACIEIVPACDGGWCVSTESYIPNAECSPEGVCVEAVMQCEDFGGTCLMDVNGCPYGWRDLPYPCLHGGVCCVRDDPSSCEDAGGLCLWWGEPCPPGMVSDPDLYCILPEYHCCTQQEQSPCEREGGRCISDYTYCPPDSVVDPSIPCNDSDEVCCMPATENECERADGYCSDFTRNCRDGYVALASMMGCDWPTPLCCVPEYNPGCTNDSECGPPSCTETQSPIGLTCTQYEPYCSEEGVCESRTSYLYNGLCVDGWCIEAECRPGETRWHYCENGEAVPWCRCDDRGQWRCETDDPDELCPHELSCEEEGGYCTRPRWGCDEGYYGVDDPMGCTRPEGLCCLREDVPWECTSDWDCGETYCYQEGEMLCIMIHPYCSPWGSCEMDEEFFENAVCNGQYCEQQECYPGEEQWYYCDDGQAVPWCFCNDMGWWDCITDNPEELCGPIEPIPCGDIGGFCIDTMIGCFLPGFHEEYGAYCEGNCFGGGCVCCVMD